MAEMSGENKVVVNIFGEEYPISGGSDPTHISRIADLVDTRMRDASQDSRIKGRDKIAILAAMSIASEMYDYSKELETSKDLVNTRVESLLKRLDSVLAKKTG